MNTATLIRSVVRRGRKLRLGLAKIRDTILPPEIDTNTIFYHVSKDVISSVKLHVEGVDEVSSVAHRTSPLTFSKTTPCECWTPQTAKTPGPVGPTRVPDQATLRSNCKSDCLP